jgi:hypothetical protein
MSVSEQDKETIDVSSSEARDNAGNENIQVDESQNDSGNRKDPRRYESQQEEIAEREKIEQTTQGIQITASHDSLEKKSTVASTGPPYSSFGPWEKRFIVFAATMGAFFSPFTAQIYFPALNTIAKDLNVSPSKINLTMTTYMVRLTAPSTYSCQLSNNF